MSLSMYFNHILGPRLDRIFKDAFATIQDNNFNLHLVSAQNNAVIVSDKRVDLVSKLWCSTSGKLWK